MSKLRTTVLFIGIFFGFATMMKAQLAPSIEWENTTGGAGDDRVNDIQQTTDGGYIVVGAFLSSSLVDKSEPSIGAIYTINYDCLYDNLDCSNNYNQIGEYDPVLFPVDFEGKYATSISGELPPPRNQPINRKKKLIYCNLQSCDIVNSNIELFFLIVNHQSVSCKRTFTI